MGKQWKQWLTLFWGGGSKITADGDCSHEIKERLLRGRKVMTNLDSILRSKDIVLSTNVCLVKAMEEATAPHSSTLAWKIPWTEEPRRLQSMGSAKGQTRLSDFTFTFHLHALEKETATHSSVLAW